MSDRVAKGAGVAAGAALLLTALLLPTGWYDGLPRPELVPQLVIRGSTLLRLMLGLQGLAIVALSLRGLRWTPLPADVRARSFAPRDEADDIGQAQAMRWLALITLLGIALRVYGINSDFWIDELLSVRQFTGESLVQILGAYRTSNNHLLMSLLLKASVAAFGTHEWSVRLATMTFGIISVPALYRLARLALSRRSSLGAALLLAVSYHHIFFSQNARGYVTYVCFALLSARALMDGLRDDRLRDWVIFCVTTLLGFMALLNTMFVIAAQLLVVGGVIVQARQRGATIRPLVGRVAAVFAVTAFLCIEVYAISLPEAYAFITRAYTMAMTGFDAGSSELRQDVARGVLDGFGMGVWLAAVPFLSLAAAGLFVLWRRSWAVTTMLLMPGVLTAGLLASRGMTFSPRFFLLWLPLAVLTAVATIDAAARHLRAWQPPRQRALSVAVVVVLAVLSAASLRRYYTVPKQPYTAAVRYLERVRGPNDVVFLFHPTQLGMRYYGAKLTVPLEGDYVPVRTSAELDSALAAYPGRRVLAVSTLERGLSVARPELFGRLQTGWTRDTTLAATIGNGEISIWSPRTGHPADPR